MEREAKSSDVVRPLERIQSELEASFCPPLDPALIAALVSELDPADDSDALESLRLTLSDLATEAAVAKALNQEPLPSEQLTAENDSPVSGSQTSTTLLRETGNSVSGTSAPSSDASTFDTPLGFLRTVFPHLPVQTLQHAIDAAYAAQKSSTDAGELDMGLLVESILTEEFLREEQGRAASGTSSDENGSPAAENDWSLVQKKENRKNRDAGSTRSQSVPTSPKPRKVKANTVPLVDLLQRQHVPANRPSVDFDVAPDPWSHLASLATTLGQLVPDMPERKWLALFHNPAYPTPSHAVRAELQRLSLMNTEPVPSDTLRFLLEVIGVDEKAGGASDKSHDAELCLRACRNNAESALDLFRLLEEMDLAGAAVIHSAPSQTFQSTVDLTTSGVRAAGPLTSVSRSVPQSPIPSAPPSPPPSTQQKRIPTRGQYQWQTVAPRKPVVPEPHPLAAHIPAYRIADQQNGKRKGRPGPAFKNQTEITPAPPIPSGLSELEKCRWWVKELRRQRDEAIRAAGRHWRAGTAQDRGGEIAFYYAEQGRKLEEESREWALKAARLQVQQQQSRSNDIYTIDLHGLTLQEALHVVKEGVNAWYSSSGSGYAPNHSLTIITGLGKHSANQQSILGPAIYRALEKDGWRVVKRPAAVVVTGVARA